MTNRFRETEIGPIPEDWRCTEIGQLDPFVTSGSRGWAEFYSEFGSPFIRITNLSRRSIDLDLRDLKFVRIPPGASEATRTQLQAEDVLISITADIGIVGYVDGDLPCPAYINQHIALVRFDASKVSSRFVSYFLASTKPQSLFRASTDVGAKAGMSLSTVRKLRLALPPVSEQRAIAEALTDVDALLGAQDRLIAKKRDLNQTAAQQLLTGKRRLSGFRKANSGWQKTDIGLIPDDWRLVRIRDAGDVLGGRQRSPHAVGDMCKYLRVANVLDDHLDLSDVLEMPFSTAEKDRFRLRDGDILLNEGQSIDLVGRSAIYRGIPAECCYQNTLLRFRAKNGTDVNFVQRLFQEYLRRGAFAAIAYQTTSIAHLGAGRFSLMKIPYPPLSEQSAIASALGDMNAEIAALERRRDKTRLLKQGMMQKLLTGRIRLI